MCSMLCPKMINFVQPAYTGCALINMKERLLFSCDFYIIVSGGSRISRRGGGVDLVRGAVDPRSGYVSKILHVKTKESGPVGGARAGRAPPRSANDSI